MNSTKPQDDLVFVGCFSETTGGVGHGITRLLRDVVTGELRGPAVVTEAVDPNWLALGPDGRVLYATKSGPAGTVSAWSIGPDGELGKLSEHSTGGDDPCYIAISPDGRWLAVPSYLDGSVSLHGIGTDGAVGPSVSIQRHQGKGPVVGRQEGPHAHSTLFSPDGEYLYVADLGLDTIFAYTYATGELVPASRIDTGAGTGPRHMAIVGERMFVVHEISSTIGTIALGPGGSGKRGGTISSLAEATGSPNYPSEIRLADLGKRLVVANRLADVLTIFDSSKDQLRLVGEFGSGGAIPRHFTVKGLDLYVCNQRSGDLTHFRLSDWDSLAIESQDAFGVVSPSCVVIQAR